MSSEAIRDDVSLWLRQAAEPVRADEGRKAQITRAARRLGLAWGEAKRLWYGERRSIPADLYLRLKARKEEIEEAQLRLLRAELAAREARIAERKERDAAYQDSDG